MRHKTQIPDAIRTLAGSRRGLVTRRELLDAGLSRRAVDGIASRCCTMLPGVYLLGRGPDVAASTLDHETRAWAGLLHAGTGAYLAGRSAAHYLKVLDRPPRVIEIAIPHGRTVSSQPGYLFVRHRPGVHAEPLPRAMPTLRVEDVVLDLAATGSLSDAIGLLATACQRGTTRASRILDRLGERRRHPRREVLTAVLQDIAGGSTSHLEVGYLTRVERAHGLRPTVRQFAVPGSGHRSDGAYPAERLLLEHDGSAFHSGEQRLDDLALDARHLGLRWSTIRTAHTMVFAAACELAARVEGARVARGGEPCFIPCPECPTAGRSASTNAA